MERCSVPIKQRTKRWDEEGNRQKTRFGADHNKYGKSVTGTVYRMSVLRPSVRFVFAYEICYIFVDAFYINNARVLFKLLLDTILWNENRRAAI